MKNIDELPNIQQFLFYCREGYEADLAAELDMKSARENLFGYSQTKANSCMVQFNTYSPLTANQIQKGLSFSSLVFARQRLLSLGNAILDKPYDRVGSLLNFLESVKVDIDSVDGPLFGDVVTEYPDNEAGKPIAKFCKKFLVPLRQALRKRTYLSAKPNKSLPYLHLYFLDSSSCIVALSVPKNRSEHPMGIMRLKFPHDAPSRSTLKLEEAIKTFLTPAEQLSCFQKGMTAVDLGACPGGWTYQLVERGLHVEAIDNGAMAESLMETGLVSYFAADGFTYQPQDGHVDWLVCDMIEKPERVAVLMSEWLLKRKTTSVIFNLKLPMKQRFQVVDTLLNEMEDKLVEKQMTFKTAAKHLYHDRDEVTVIIRGSMHLSL